jgi:hypothetical protein
MVDFNLLKAGAYVLTSHNKKAQIIDDFNLVGLPVKFVNEEFNVNEAGNKIDWRIHSYIFDEGVNYFYIVSDEFSPEHTYTCHGIDKDLIILSDIKVNIKIGFIEKIIDISPLQITNIIDADYKYFRVSYTLPNDEKVYTYRYLSNGITVIHDAHGSESFLNNIKSKIEKFRRCQNIYIQKIEYVD